MAHFYGNNVYITTEKDNIKNVADFLKFIDTKNLKKTKSLQACCILGRGIVKISPEHIENVCNIIATSPQLEKGSLSLTTNFGRYGDNLMKINRSYTSVKKNNKKQLDRSFRKNGPNYSARAYVFDQFIAPCNTEPLNEDWLTKRSWDEEITNNTATYYHNLILKKVNGILEEPIAQHGSHINPKQNSRLDISEGINTSMYYLAVPLSFSEMHIEDSCLPSLNVVHFNLQKDEDDAVAKVWIIVPNKEKLYKAVNKHKKQSDEINLGCRYLDRKDCYINLNFFVTNNIMYHVVHQMPGDIIFVDCGVFHQVINVHANFAEAINFGTAKLNLSNPLASVCHCRGMSQIKIIRHNRAVVHVVKSRSVRIHDCPFDCDFQTSRKDELGKHMKIVHKILKPFSCDHCKMSYSHYNTLNNHNCSKQPSKSRPFCKICGKQVSKLSRHEKTHIHDQNVSHFKDTQKNKRRDNDDENNSKNKGKSKLFITNYSIVNLYPGNNCLTLRYFFFTFYCHK